MCREEGAVVWIENLAADKGLAVDRVGEENAIGLVGAVDAIAVLSKLKTRTLIR